MVDDQGQNTIEETVNKPQVKKRPVAVLLLTAVVVLGVVVTLIITNVKEAKARERDLTRRGDLRQLQQALERYKGDEDKYPNTLRVLETDYLPRVPQDPINKDPYVYVYTPAPDSEDYTLTALLEVRGSIECSGGSECVVTLEGP
jgi:general secretion pathway protein G